MTLKTLITTTALCVGLAGCGQKPGVDQAQQDPSAIVPTAATDGTFSVSPGSVSDCTQRVVATLKWDVRTTRADVANVQIFAGTDAASTLFAEAGNFGESKTGPWTGAGSTFSLRDKASGKEIGRVKVTGPVCD